MGAILLPFPYKNTYLKKRNWTKIYCLKFTRRLICERNFVTALLSINTNNYTKRTVLLKYLKIQLDTNLKIIEAIKIIMLGSQTESLECQNFLRHCSSYLNIHHNHLAGPIKLFSDQYPAKCLDNLDKIVPFAHMLFAP
jgi:hypothetical protein